MRNDNITISEDRRNYLVAKRAISSALRHTNSLLEAIKNGSVKRQEFYTERVRESIGEYNRVESKLYDSVKEEQFTADLYFIPLAIATAHNFTINRKAA